MGYPYLLKHPYSILMYPWKDSISGIQVQPDILMHFFWCESVSEFVGSASWITATVVFSPQCRVLAARWRAQTRTLFLPFVALLTNAMAVRNNHLTPIQTYLSWGLVSEAKAKEWSDLRYVHDFAKLWFWTDDDRCPNSTKLQFQARFRSSPGNGASRILFLVGWEKSHEAFHGKGWQCKPMSNHIPKKIAFKFWYLGSQASWAPKSLHQLQGVQCCQNGFP